MNCKLLNYISLFIILLSVGVKPVYSQGDTMYVEGRHLFSASGEKVVLRGVNEMFVWSQDKTGSWTIPEIAKSGSNCVRLVWGKDGSSSQLATLIDICIANKMIAMPECHDATGNWGALNECIMFWKDPVILNAVQKNRKWTLVNIGNEVGDGNVTSEMFKTGYKKAIDSLRKWDYTVPLVIDAPTWGQNVNVLFNTWQELLNYDPLKNIIFSAHSYWSSSSNYQRIANESINNNMPVIIGEGPSPTAYPNCNILDYKTGLKVCGENEIGWLIWSWGMVSNGHCVPNFDITSNGRFGNWETQYSRMLAVDHPYSLMRTAERPPSFFNDSSVTVSGMQLIPDMTTIAVGDSAKIEIVLAPVNASDKKYSLLLLQSKEVLHFSSDSTYVIGLAEGTATIRALHQSTGIMETTNLNVTRPVSVSKLQLNEDDIKIFPNPAKNTVTVKLPVQANIEARITNVNGIVLEEISSDGDFNIRLNTYLPGIYFVHLNYFGETKTFKVIKE